MNRTLAILFLLLSATIPSRAEIDIEVVSVGDAGNPANPDDDDYARGSVSYAYKMGKYKVTIAQYTAFLNAVAQTDTYNLYSPYMGSMMNIAGIARSGSSGSYAYTVKDNIGSSSNRPIAYVTWFRAARFANWMANGQPAGAQDATTTEDGAYTLNGATNGNFSIARNVTNPNTGQAVAWWIPSEDEWYKAAFYKGSGDGYWLYPTRSDERPDNIPGSTNGANYRYDYSEDGIYSFTQSGTYSTTQNYLTAVGAFDSPGPYGTYDQGGALHEWTEGVINGMTRARYGAAWGVSYNPAMQSSFRGGYFPETENQSIGFRLARADVMPPPGIDRKGIWLEAESGTIGGDWMVITGETDTSEGAYVSTAGNVGQNYSTAGASGAGTCALTFTSTGGTYAIWARVIAPTSSDDSMFVKFDVSNYGGQWDLPESSTWAWVKYANTNLPAGERTLTLCQREDGLKIDKVFLANNLDYIPTGQGGSAIPSATNWTLTASAGANGSIWPASATVAVGGSTNFVITPDPYYYVTNLYVNGVLQTPTTNYVWTDVSANGTITVAFAQALAASNSTPQWWLAQYGLTNGGASFEVAEGLDTDGDGLSAWEEYIAGCNPTSVDSRFEVSEPEAIAQGNRIAWTPVEGRRYDLYWSTNIASGFQALETGMTWPRSSATDTTHNAQQQIYYRLKVSLEP